MKINNLKLYKKYTLNDLKDVFEDGSFQFGGGMIYNSKTNVLVLISKHTKDRLYGDKIEDGKIHYTGMGKYGDQTVNLKNKRLVNAKRDNTQVYMFLSYKPNEYSYYGRVSLDDPYYYDFEIDADKNNRRVLKFPLTFLDALAPMNEKELKNTMVAGNIRTIKAVGACICINDKYLVATRSSEQGDEGKCEFPGGKVEENETHQEALIREIKEELDVDIKILDELASTNYYSKKNNCVINLTVYNSLIINGEPTPKEGQKIEWKTIDELENSDWLPADVDIVQTLIDKQPKKIVGTIEFNYKKGEYKEPKPSSIKRACQDYEKSQKQKMKSGDEAEQAVMLYEANKLNSLNRGDLAAQIEQVSKSSPDNCYDIKSFDIVDGIEKEIHIEVKAATLNANKVEFFMSYAELREFRNDKCYKVYALIRYGKNYQLHIINKEKFMKDDKYLSPVSYKVSIPIEYTEH